MPDDIRIDRKTLHAALEALGETSPVYSAYKEKGFIVIHFCGRTEPVKWKPPPAKKTTTTPRAAKPKRATTTPKKPTRG